MNCLIMEDSLGISKEMEVKKSAKTLENRRRRVSKCLSVLFKKEETNEAQKKDIDDENTKKDAELTQAAGKLELKRKMIGKWLEKCKQKDEEC